MYLINLFCINKFFCLAIIYFIIFFEIFFDKDEI
jgi:hypothetical protein